MTVLTLKGKVWKYGDNVSVFYFFPAKYEMLGIAGQPEKLARHFLEEVDPHLIDQVEAGDVLVAGKGFGQGKHHWYYTNAFRKLGFAGFIAESFHPQFQRDCIDRGIPAIAYKHIPSKVEFGDLLELDLRTGKGNVVNRSTVITVMPAPEIFISILAAGGLKPYTLQKLAARSRS
jgi:3-isopropylmalate dehydratase small subunit